MDNLFFLPHWPLQATSLSRIGLMLLCAVLLGEGVHRFLRLPRITGYVLASIALSPSLIGPWLPPATEGMQPIYTVAFGLIAFELGQRTDLGWLRRNPWLLVTSVAESLLSFLLAGALLWMLGLSPLVCVLTAGLAAATGPATVLGITKETRARGQITERLYLLSALSSCYTFLALGITYAWIHLQNNAPLSLSLLHPVYLMLGSILLGGVIARAILFLLSFTRSVSSGQNLGAVAMIVASVALVEMLNLSVLVTLLVAGILCRAMDSQRRMQPLDFGLVGHLALIVMFVSLGALIEPQFFATALVPALGLVAARGLGKFVGICVFARPSGLSLRKASLLSVSMLPISGAVILWMDSVARIQPELGQQMAGILLLALLMMELISPPLLQFALRRAGETTTEN